MRLRSGWLRAKILKILEKERVLNTVEVCRLLNGREKRDVDYCYKGQGFTFGRREGGWDTGVCNRPNCDPVWNEVYKLLSQLLKKALIETVKIRFFDHTPGRRGRSNDVFRFWFIDFTDFDERILRQTLVPYIQGEKHKVLEASQK